MALSQLTSDEVNVWWAVLSGLIMLVSGCAQAWMGFNNPQVGQRAASRLRLAVAEYLPRFAFLPGRADHVPAVGAAVSQSRVGSCRHGPAAPRRAHRVV